MSTENKDNGLLKLLAGLAIGTCAGYAIGLLNAEKPGVELRRDLENNSRDFFSSLRDRVEDLRDQASTTIHDFREMADEKLKASARDIQEQVNSLGKQLDDLTKKHINR